MAEMIIVPTECFCGIKQNIVMPKAAKDAWDSGMFLQDAWPEGTADDREALISGICPKCWADFSKCWADF